MRTGVIDDSVETMKKYISVLPEHLVRRFIAREGDAVLVTGRLPDVDASRILPVVETIDKALDSVRKANPGYEVTVTGLPALAARNSPPPPPSPPLRSHQWPIDWPAWRSPRSA